MHINPQQLHLFYLFIHFLYKSVVLGIIRHYDTLLRLSNLDLQISLLYYAHKCHTLVYCAVLRQVHHIHVRLSCRLHVLRDSYSDILSPLTFLFRAR